MTYILDYNKNAQKILSVASRVDKRKSEPKPDVSIPKRVVLRRGKVTKIKRDKKNINNKLFKNTLLFTKIEVIFTKNYARQKVKEMRIKDI